MDDDVFWDSIDQSTESDQSSALLLHVERKKQMLAVGGGPLDTTMGQSNVYSLDRLSCRASSLLAVHFFLDGFEFSRYR